MLGIKSWVFDLQCVSGERVLKNHLHPLSWCKVIVYITFLINKIIHFLQILDEKWFKKVWKWIPYENVGNEPKNGKNDNFQATIKSDMWWPAGYPDIRLDTFWCLVWYRVTKRSAIQSDNLPCRVFSPSQDIQKYSAWSYLPPPPVGVEVYQIQWPNLRNMQK